MESEAANKIAVATRVSASADRISLAASNIFNRKGENAAAPNMSDAEACVASEAARVDSVKYFITALGLCALGASTCVNMNAKLNKAAKQGSDSPPGRQQTHAYGNNNKCT